MTADCSHPAHYARTTVDHQAVNQTAVSTFPEARTQAANATRQHLLVEPVNVVLVLQDTVDKRAVLFDSGRQGGISQVHVPAHHSTSHNPPEWQRPKTVYG